MHMGQRILATLRGHKLLRLHVSPRKNGMLVTSPDLPGFSIMLQPGDIDSDDTLNDVLAKPLAAFITAEMRAYRTYRAKAEAREAKPVHVTVQHKPNSHEISAQWCTA